MRQPVGRQRIPLEPQQAHAPGLPPGQDALDDGRLQQRKPQQLVDRQVVQAFALCDLAAAADHAVVEQLLPLESPRQCHQQALVDLGDHAQDIMRWVASQLPRQSRCNRVVFSDSPFH